MVNLKVNGKSLQKFQFHVPSQVAANSDNYDKHGLLAAVEDNPRLISVGSWITGKHLRDIEDSGKAEAAKLSSKSVAVSYFAPNTFMMDVQRHAGKMEKARTHMD